MQEVSEGKRFLFFWVLQMHKVKYYSILIRTGFLLSCSLLMVLRPQVISSFHSLQYSLFQTKLQSLLPDKLLPSFLYSLCFVCLTSIAVYSTDRKILKACLTLYAVLILVAGMLFIIGSFQFPFDFVLSDTAQKIKISIQSPLILLVSWIWAFGKRKGYFPE